MKRKQKQKLIIYIVLLLVALFGGKTLMDEPSVPQHAEGMLRVSFLDVGQGDSAFIILPDGQTVLIDAGEADSAQTVIDYIEATGNDTIDYLICTHPHSDHIGGMRKVLERFTIQNVYMPKVYHDSFTYENLLSAIQKKGLTIHTAKAGVSLSPEDNVTLSFVAPCRDDYEDINNASCVLRLTYGEKSFLFTGDAEKQAEWDMLESGQQLSSDVLKVGHHGSSTSTGQAFLNAVNPRWAIISVGADNEYGHPHVETMASLTSRRQIKQILRTDEEGTITLISDGNQIWRWEEEQ